MKNKIKVTLLLGLIILFGVKLQPSFAEDSYQFELEPEYVMLEDDDDNEATGYGLTGRFFFWPVKIGDHPYAEDAFLERVGSIELFYGRVDAEFEIGGAEVEGDGPEYGSRLIYMRPGSPIFFQAEYFKSELEIDLDDFGLDAVEIEGDEYEIQLGWFLGKTFGLPSRMRMRRPTRMTRAKRKIGMPCSPNIYTNLETKGPSIWRGRSGSASSMPAPMTVPIPTSPSSAIFILPGVSV